eukprot:CAMPEP_0117038728 /NCGR_PEP_ID=MMETSP0472-20121206/27230_1 /TAXON_ID=693140 ORGANISM="Tiarina fusus, Strain LIS" /NCGR_SAMPLE_ID=MMETSP0472 /ASSEMBLY_ACC=CAM_ASM_000603 /LENGTH=338 /DNA_ID=CAMNT_0004749031 /DNA_START=171 /DNA_END=1187 /DNA_ORIENTATION=-
MVECYKALFDVEVPKVTFLVAMVAVEIPLSWIKDIRKLTPSNVVATALIAYGLFFVLVLAFVQGMAVVDDNDIDNNNNNNNNNNGEGTTRVFVENLKALPAITNSWFLFAGTSFFMMEGSITLLVPLQEGVLHDADKAQFPATNQAVTTYIVGFYIAFSLICCAAFGDGVQTALTASLNGTMATTVQLAYSVAVILTFPLQAFPAMAVVKNKVFGPEQQQDASSSSSSSRLVESSYSTSTITNSKNTRRDVLAAFVICGLGVIAYCAIDYLGNVVSILGSLFGIPLALVAPPLMHNRLVEDSTRTTQYMNYGVVVVGLMAMGAASFATLVAWEMGAEG